MFQGMAGASLLFTDQYELTMAQAYARQGMFERAVFELAYRELPRERSYVDAARLSDVEEFLQQARFSAEDLGYLASLGQYSPEFLRRLREFRFTGDVWAVPEGTLVFPNEPIVQVSAPMIEAQIVETLVLNQVHFQSVIGSKAARLWEAAEGRGLVDFGSRRAHGVEAALKVARASYLAGASGTSNLLAGRLYRIPTFGTMAHSFVQAFEREEDAFRIFAEIYPGSTLLVDTYDTLRGVERAIELVRANGLLVSAVRLDSGDLGGLARAARMRLDQAGLQQIRIFASSELDEHAIRTLLQRGAPIDAFGVGTNLAVSKDAPALDMAYKLVEYAGVGRAKLSSKKLVYPGRKQVYRVFGGDGSMQGDLVCDAREGAPGEPLLEPVMQGGERLPEAELGLESARCRALAGIEAFRSVAQRLSGQAYPVRISERLRASLERIREREGSREGLLTTWRR